jgi:hypothetical protein
MPVQDCRLPRRKNSGSSSGVKRTSVLQGSAIASATSPTPSQALDFSNQAIPPWERVQQPGRLNILVDVYDVPLDGPYRLVAVRRSQSSAPWTSPNTTEKAKGWGCRSSPKCSTISNEVRGRFLQLQSMTLTPLRMRLPPATSASGTVPRSLRCGDRVRLQGKASS